LAFASEGARGVAFADINLTAALEAAEESKAQATNSAYRAIAVQVDVSSEESVQRMVDTTLKEFNRIDYGVNSAGVSWSPLRRIRSNACHTAARNRTGPTSVRNMHGGVRQFDVRQR
jgi:NAD(P)-dependent dehydrogenase (short-subunit alcohol dehydrogenase family)